jgi:predicted HD superfamily hydrolase involved in NAD metabolism
LSAPERLPSSFAERLDRCLDGAQERLRPERFFHSLGVCHTGVVLARLCGADPEAAAVAGLLHDVAKDMPREALREDLERRGRPLDETYENFPSLWHAPGSAVWAEQDFGVTAPDVLEAIRLHPTGDAGASLLARVIFVADYTEPARHWDGIEDIRRLSGEDLQAAAALAIAQKTEHVRRKGKAVHPRALRALEAWNGGGNLQAVDRDRTWSALEG